MATSSFPAPNQASSLVVVPLDENDAYSRPPLLSLFFAFQIIGGHIGFPLLLVAIFALGNVSSRHPLFINFCVIWLISSVVFCIMLYTSYDTGPEPPFMICALQASLVYAMPIMATVALTALVFHLWLYLRGSMNQAIIAHLRKIQWALVALPYLLALPYIIAPALMAAMDPNLVSRRRAGFGYFCSLDSEPLRIGVATSVAVFLVLLLVSEFLIARIFYKNWKSLRTVKVYGWTGANLLTRVALFTLYILCGIVACMTAITVPYNHFRILFQASLPTASFLFFATRPNLWKRGATTSTTTQRNPSTTTSNSFTSFEGPACSPAPSTTNTFIAPIRAHSTDTNGISQVARASTFASVESAYSATENGAVDMNLGGTAWVTFPQDPAPSGGVRGPDAAEKGIHQKVYDSTSIKSVRGQPPRWI